MRRRRYATGTRTSSPRELANWQELSYGRKLTVLAATATTISVLAAVWAVRPVFKNFK